MKPNQKLSLFRAQRVRAGMTGQPAATFGQARAEALQSRHSQRVEQRRTLKRAEYATQDQEDSTIHQAVKRKGESVGREIGRIQKEMELQEQDKLKNQITDELSE